jgi:hypothetical protein
MAIVNSLKSYVFGPMRFMNQQTRMNLANRMISFDIKDSPDVGKGTLMFLILEYVYTQMKKSKTRKILVIDEAWTILSSGEQSEYVLRLVKTCRKFNLALIMITQDVEDVLSSRAGRAVLTNTATKLLIKQDTSILDEIVKQFNLNEAEKRFMKIATAGRALLIAETSRIPIYIHASPEEHRIITTKPDEMLQIESADVKKPMSKEVYREFNVNLPIHRKVDLTDEQLRQLEVRDYMEIRVKMLNGESDLFLIRNESEDTDEHFVLQHLILDEIRKYTEKGLIHHTRLPDITFETPNSKMVAIEVETDVGLKRSLESMEAKLNVMKKYDDNFFVVENPTILQDYKEKFGTMISRTEVPGKIASYFT